MPYKSFMVDRRPRLIIITQEINSKNLLLACSNICATLHTDTNRLIASFKYHDLLILAFINKFISTVSLIKPFI